MRVLGLSLLALVVVAAGSARAQPTPGPVSAPVAGEGCRVAVMDLQNQGLPAEQAHLAGVLTEVLATSAASASGCEVVTRQDITSMVDFEAQRAACGGDVTDSCLAEIGSALGVERIVTGSVSRIGDSTTVSARLLNLKLGKVDARAEETTRDDARLRSAAQLVGQRLFGGDTASPTTTTDAAGPSVPLLVTGGVVSGVGLVVAVVGGAIAVASDGVLGDSGAPRSAKDDARETGTTGPRRRRRRRRRRRHRRRHHRPRLCVGVTMRALPLLSIVFVGGCRLFNLEPVACVDDASCPTGAVCGEDGTCAPGAVEGEGEEGEGDVGEGEGEGDVGEGEGEIVGEGEGEAVGEGEGEGEGEPICIIGGECRPRVLARNLTEPRGLAVTDDGRVYSTASGLAGGCVIEVGPFSAQNVVCEGVANTRPLQVAVTDDHVWWAVELGNDDAVRRADLDGSEASVLTILDGEMGDIGTAPVVAAAGATAVFLLQLDAGDRNVCVTDEAGDDVTVCHDAGTSFPKSVATLPAKVFFGGNAADVFTVDVGDPPAVEPVRFVAKPGIAVASAMHLVGDAVVGAFGFKDSFSDDDLGVVVFGDNGPRAVPSGADTAVLFVAVDDTHAWWLTGREPDLEFPALFRVPLDAGDVAERIVTVGEPGGLAVDDDFVYWTELDSNPTDGGRVLRVRKPR